MSNLKKQKIDKNDVQGGQLDNLVRPLTYLACPYSHDDRAIRVKRFKAVNRAAGILMNQGHKVFSPISHTHPIAEASDLPKDWDYWKDFDRAYLEHSHKIIVLMLDGWEESKGVLAELEIAHEMGLDVHYMPVV